MRRSGQRPRTLLSLIVLCLLAPAGRAASFPSSAQIQQAFAAVNLSGSQRITAKEWDQASFALFRAADKNNDDFIDRDELRDSNLAPDTFLRADLNRDDKLSVAEFVDLRRAMFNTADIDRTEYLTPSEFELLILMERVGWQDTNQNGRIELSELTASLIQAFDAIDADHDGFLTAGEAGYMRSEAFQLFDTNRDGKLSRDEFILGYRTEMLSG